MARKVTPRKKDTVEVKNASQVMHGIDTFLSRNLHGRFNHQLSSDTQKKLVSYGPWLSTLLVVVLLPELMVFAKQGSLMNFSGFFNIIFFNQQSWVIMLVMLGNIVLLVDGISYLFEKKRRGWTRIYQISILSTVYILWQLFANIIAPAPALISLIAMFIITFTLLDVKKHYK